ncbi:hypothetical protein CRG98_008197, partial [Punica granatum]
MDGRRRNESPVYGRQWSSESGVGTGGVTSPTMSPSRYHHSRTSSATAISSVKRTQNFAAKAAAQRLAQVMASQTADDDEEDGDDLGFRYSAPPPMALSMHANAGGVSKPAASSARIGRSPSPALGRNFTEETTATRSPSAGRSAMSLRPSPMAAPDKVPLRTAVSLPPFKPPSSNHRKDTRFPSDSRQLNSKPTGDDHDASALRDELDMLQDEKEENQEKLSLAEARCKEVEDRIKELEKQVAALGEGVSLEAKLLSRKEAALRQREAALKDAKQTSNGVDKEITALRSEVE